MKHKVYKRTFDYIDAMPGSGKTEYFVNSAIRMLASKKSDTSLIYAAPTIALLLEALDRIRAHPKFKERYKDRITLVATPERVRVVAFDKCQTVMEKPSAVLNYLLGLSDTCGELETSHLPKQIEPGEILMTTHESFVQVSHVDHTGNNFARARKCRVIFDEARHCVLETKVLSDVSNENLVKLSSCFTFSRVVDAHQLNRKGKEGKQLYICEVSQAPSKKDLKGVFSSKTWASIPKAIRDLRQTVNQYTDNGRASVFLMANVNPESLLSAEDKRATVSVSTLLRPTSLFNHYHSVVLTSAFFKDSQLYHFLKADGHKFRNLKTSQTEELVDIYKRDKQLKEALSKRLLVSVLMSQPLGYSSARLEYRNNLTSALLSNGMVVPNSLAAKIGEGSIREDLTSSQVIRTLLENKLVTSDVELQRKLKEYCQPPLWILLRQASAIIKKCQEQGHLKVAKDGYKHLALLVLNVKSSTWSHRRVPYASVVRTLYRQGKLKTIDVPKVFDLESEDDAHRLNTTSPYWQRLLADNLYVGSPNKKFLIPRSNRLHGINLYSDLNAFVHLAALNPTPQMIEFYKLLLGPSYDIEQDHSIENLVQMLYRTSLRKVDCTDKVLMIVPYQTQVDLLKEKIGCGDFEKFSSPTLRPWTYRKQVEISRKKEIAKIANTASKLARGVVTRSEESTKKCKTIRVAISQIRRKIKDNPDHPKVNQWEAKIESYQEQLSKLV